MKGRIMIGFPIIIIGLLATFIGIGIIVSYVPKPVPYEIEVHKISAPTSAIDVYRIHDRLTGREWLRIGKTIIERPHRDERSFWIIAGDDEYRAASAKSACEGKDVTPCP